MERCCVVEYFAHGGHQHRRPERLADRQREQPGNQRHPFDRGEGHHRARHHANPDTEEERPAQPDGVGQRTDQQRDDRHRDGPRRHDTAGVRIAIAKIGHQPERERQDRHLVSHDTQKLHGERNPKLARRSFEHGEFAYEAGARGLGLSLRPGFGSGVCHAAGRIRNQPRGLVKHERGALACVGAPTPACRDAPASWNTAVVDRHPLSFPWRVERAWMVLG